MSFSQHALDRVTPPPLSRPTALPAFPVDTLSPGSPARRGSTQLPQTALDLPGAVAIDALASRAVVEGRPGHPEPMNPYALTASPSGTPKSPSFWSLFACRRGSITNAKSLWRSAYVADYPKSQRWTVCKWRAGWVGPSGCKVGWRRRYYPAEVHGWVLNRRNAR